MRWSTPELVHLLWGVLALALLALAAERARRRTERSLGEPEALRALSGEAGRDVHATGRVAAQLTQMLAEGVRRSAT